MLVAALADTWEQVGRVRKRAMNDEKKRARWQAQHVCNLENVSLDTKNLSFVDHCFARIGYRRDRRHGSAVESLHIPGLSKKESMMKPSEDSSVYLLIHRHGIRT